MLSRTARAAFCSEHQTFLTSHEFRKLYRFPPTGVPGVYEKKEENISPLFIAKVVIIIGGANLHILDGFSGKLLF